MLCTASTRVTVFAEKAATGAKRRQARRRHFTSPTFSGCAGGTGCRGTGGFVVCRARVFMMDVRMLLLIIGFGRNGPTLE
jgi:hypothetical protein